MSGPGRDPAPIDVTVVGGGVCGCVVAGRLADAGVGVALIEAGPPGPLPAALRSGDIGAGTPETCEDWFRIPARFAALDGTARAPYLQGRGLGGGSAVNGMVLSAGVEADYRSWSELLGSSAERQGATRRVTMDSGPSVGDERLPARVVDDGLEPDAHAHRIVQWLNRAVDRLDPEIVAGGAVARCVDAVVGERWGVGPGAASSRLGARGLLPVSVAGRHGFRRTVAEAYLGAGVEVWPNTTVDRVEHESGRVKGVILSTGRRLATGHVVLCAGPVETPRLLMKSSLVVGSRDRGRGGGSTIRFAGLDHPGVAFSFDWPVGDGNHGQVVPARVRRLVRARVEAPVVARSSSGSDPRSDTADVAMQVIGPFAGRNRNVGVVLIMTEPTGAPVELAFHGREIVRVVRGWLPAAGGPSSSMPPWLVRHAARLVDDLAGELFPVDSAGPSGMAYLDDSGTPLSALTSISDDDIVAWMDRHPAPVYHLGSTIARSVDLVPPDRDRPGALAGVEGLTIADTSTMPGLVGGGLQLAAMAWAELVGHRLVSVVGG